VDRNPDALKLAEQLGAHHTVVADGGQVDAVQQLTNGGADVVLTSLPRRERRTRASR
jgi:NAD+-dependent secondary alcohol dehydrogenase Adh1